MTSNRLIPLGVIAGVHGVHGRVKIKSYTETPEDIADYAPLTDAAGGRSFSLRITGETKGLLLAEIEGIATREQAEALRGVELCAPYGKLKRPEEDDSFLIADLIGLPVTLANDTLYGTVKAVHNYGAGDILEIQPPEGASELLLFTRENFPKVTTTSLTFRPPEILRVTAEEAVEKAENSAD